MGYTGKNYPLLSLWVVLLFGLLACGDPEPIPLTLEALQNAEYLSEFTDIGRVQLVDGEHREAIVEGGAAELMVRMIGHTLGDLDGDGKEDAAVLLVTSAGGSGTFRHLAAVINRDGVPENTATELLGDRVKVVKISIQEGLIVVDLLTHGREAPMAEPSLKVRSVFQLEGKELVRQEE